MANPKRGASARSNPPGGRRHQRRELLLPDGARLVLKADSSIERIPAEGETQTWRPDDPEWAGHALRFGLHQQPRTLPPSGRSVEGTKPPHR